MSRWLRHLGWALAVPLACSAGGGVTAPPPPPPPPPTLNVNLRTDRSTVFLGRRLPLSVLVASVTDGQAQPVTDATLSATTSLSWTLSHDTLIAPLFETTGTMQITATRGASHGTSTPVSLLGIVNLDTLHLTGSTITCRMIYQPGHVSHASDDSVGPVDSITMIPVADSIPNHYLGTTGNTGTPPLSYVLGFTRMSLQIWLSGSELIYGSQPPYVAHYQRPDTGYYLTPKTAPISWQTPDTIVFSYPQDVPSSTPLTWAVRQSATTYRAPGLAFCPLISTGSFWTADSITLTSH